MSYYITDGRLMTDYATLPILRAVMVELNRHYGRTWLVQVVSASR